MSSIRHFASRRRFAATLLLALVFLPANPTSTAHAHPLGNFTINHFARIEPGAERVLIHYVVDMAEIPTLQELQGMNADANEEPSDETLRAYLERVALQYANGIRLTIDNKTIALQMIAGDIKLIPGSGGLLTLRVECDFGGDVPVASRGALHRLRFEDVNHPDRIGWHEIVVNATAGVSVFDSSAFADGISKELTAYPEDLMIAPLTERVAALSFKQGTTPAGAAPLRTRAINPTNRTGEAPANVSPTTPTTSTEGTRTATPRDRFTELIAVPELTLPVALLGLLIAIVLGAGHALSPGHGKAVVGAYLVGSRGTAGHALFLGLTVTVTHTIGVFALGLVTLFASQYIVPERLLPLLSLISGGIVLFIGLSLFVRRLRVVLGYSPHGHDHAHEDHAHDHSHADVHSYAHHHHHGEMSHIHSHGGRSHSHLPPGADGARVTWRSLLALGISGGLLPCPSALVVLLSAITLGRVGYGLLLVVAFSFGLAATLTAIGLLFVYAGSWMKRRAGSERFDTLARVLPTFSAFIITCVGGAICFEALREIGVVTFPALSLGALFTDSVSQAGSLSVASVLVFGFGLGLKHAVEADHLAAVTTIVSERKSLFSSSLVGGLWGVGHTISLLAVGVAVILLHIEISERAAMALELGVALMLIALGVNAIGKLILGGEFHTHPHRHSARAHAHPHLHNAGAPETDAQSHHNFRLNKRPLYVGMVHGLAGSAALMLLVLSTISAPLVGLLYIFIFGVGSVGGMMLMSALVGLPLHFTASRFTRAHLAMRGLAGLFSLCFGLFMVYEIGFVEGLFR